MALSSLATHLTFALLLISLALQSNGSLIPSRYQDSLVSFNSSLDMVDTHCYTPDRGDTPGIQPTQLQACKNALHVLVLMPDFTTKARYSRNPRTMGRKLPVGWQLGTHAECRIVLSCENDRDSAMFSYADIAQSAKKIIDSCVDQPDAHGRYPLLRWGGVNGIGDQETFYVAVARPITSTLVGGVVNGTDMLAGGEVVDGIIETS